MATDSIVAEVRRIRDELAKRFNYDIRAIIQDAREWQATGGRSVVTFTPRPAITTAGVPSPNPPTKQAGAELRLSNV